MLIETKKPSMTTSRVFALMLLASVTPSTLGHGNEDRDASAEKSASSVASATDSRVIAESFNRALAVGDEATVRALLLPNVLIYELGGVESSAAEYAGHHMPGDIAFMANLKREQLSQASGGEGATVWVATRSRLTGRFKGKEVDLDSTETLVMTQTAAGWRIAHIHWSSAPHRSPTP